MEAAPSIADRAGPSARLNLAAAARPHDAIERWLESERDQLVLWLPVALGTGAALWFALPRRSDWISVGLGLVAVGLLAIGWAPGRRAGRGLGIFALAVAVGLALAWGKAERVAAPVLPCTAVATLTGRVLLVEPQPARDRVRLTLAVTASDRAVPARVRVNVDTDKAVDGLRAGMSVRLRARLLPPAGAAVPGGYDFAEAAWFERIGATGKALDPVRRVGPAASGGSLQNVRERLTAHIEAQLPGSAGGIAASLVTGDTGAITQADADAMRWSGLAHLLSISGLHVTAVIAATMILALRLLALSPWLALRWPLPLIAAAAGAGAGIAYTVLSGMQVPTVRSCVASLLVLVGLAIGREALTLRLVAAGAVVILLVAPDAVAGPSFQLSFAAVAAIVALHEHPRMRALFGAREEGLARRLLRHTASLIVTGLAVEAALAPIALYHFQKEGLYGAFANILAIPLTTFVIMPLEAGALLADAVGAGAPLWWLAGRGLALLLWIAHRVGEAPGAVAMLPSMPTGAFALMVAGGLWLMLWRARVRRLGLVLILPGAAWALATPPPDLLVTGDGRHLALRTAGGHLAILRDRTGDYVKGMLGQAAGLGGEPIPIDDVPGARCGADMCAVAIETRAGVRRLLATRSAYPVPVRSLARACAAADIVVSDRHLPAACRPRWLKADPALLARTGGLAIRLDSERVRTVRQPGDDHPWVLAAAPASGRSAARDRQVPATAASPHPGRS